MCPFPLLHKYYVGLYYYKDNDSAVFWFKKSKDSLLVQVDKFMFLFGKSGNLVLSCSKWVDPLFLSDLGPIIVYSVSRTHVSHLLTDLLATLMKN